jgi:hypothetical protein
MPDNLDDVGRELAERGDCDPSSQPSDVKTKRSPGRAPARPPYEQNPRLRKVTK